MNMAATSDIAGQLALTEADFAQRIATYNADGGLRE